MCGICKFICTCVYLCMYVCVYVLYVYIETNVASERYNNGKPEFRRITYSAGGVYMYVHIYIYV